jgi:RNA polymerase sigma-70 factor (ECF subfamily)
MEYSALSDKDLIKKSKLGDSRAFGEIILRDSEYVFTWLLQKTRDEFLAEELLQITLIKCWNNIKNFKGDSAFKTWACAIARNLFIDNYRKMQRKNEESLEFGDGKEKLTKAMVEFDPLRKFKNEDLKFFLDEIMEALSESHKNVLHYFAVEELSYEEISKIEKCSIGTVMSRLFYARKKAQGLIKKHKKKTEYGINK